MSDQTETRRVPCEQFSRIVGYITPARIGAVDRWNAGKALEFKQRKTYRVEGVK